MDTTYYRSIAYLDAFQSYLNDIAPGSIIIPAAATSKVGDNNAGKVPMLPHKKGAYTLQHFEMYKDKCIENGALIILSKKLIVVDIDDVDWVENIINEIPDFAKTVSTKTAKGMHFYFMATEKSNNAGMKDGARAMRNQSSGLLVPIDIKTACATGSGGLISIPPSKNKQWHVAPMQNPILPMPDAFVELYVRHRVRKGSAAPKGNLMHVSRSRNEVEYCEIKDLVDILSQERKDNYSQWIAVGMCLHNLENSTRMMALWDHFSKESVKYVEGETAKKWNTFDSTKDCGLSLGSLHMWAKCDNPYLYREITNKRVYNLIVQCDGAHNSVASIASKVLKDKYVCASAKGNLWYKYDGSLWVQDPEAIMLRQELSTTVREHFYAALSSFVQQTPIFHEDDDFNDQMSKSSCITASDKSKEFHEKIDDIAYKLRDKRFKDNVVLEMREFMYDRYFEAKLDSKIHLLAFHNGVWDFDAGAFRSSRPDDYLSISVGYHYTEETIPELREKVEKYWKTMHPNEDQRIYLIKCIARQLYGDSGRELFHIHAGRNGSASNGKTRFFQLLERVLGDYIRKTHVSILTSRVREEASKPQPEYAFWKGRRLLYVSEPDHSECLHTGIVKDFTGGENVCYRLLYSNDIVTFKPQFKWHMMCNDPPKLDGTDDGMRRRTRKIDYISKFVSEDEVDEEDHMYQMDDSIFIELDADDLLKMEFLRLFLEHYSKGFGFEMPDSIRKNCECYLKDNDGVAQFVDDFIVKEENGNFTLKQAKDVFIQQEYYNGRVGTLKSDLEKLLKTVCHNQKRVNGINMRNVYTGYMLRDNTRFDY